MRYFIDLDLMSTLENIYSSVLKQIKFQNDTCNKRELKFVSFTSSIRNDGGSDKRFEILKDLLYESFKLKIDKLGKGIPMLYKPKPLNYCLQHIPIIKKDKDWGTAKYILITTYQDHSPMLSVLVVYK